MAKLTEKEISKKAIKLLKETIDSNSLNPFDDTVKSKICKFLYKTTKERKYDRFG